MLGGSDSNDSHLRTSRRGTREDGIGRAAREVGKLLDQREISDWAWRGIPGEIQDGGEV
jgi:hypothetical protein